MTEEVRVVGRRRVSRRTVEILSCRAPLHVAGRGKVRSSRIILFLRHLLINTSLQRMRVLDLFCGGGGLACGFAMEGHTVVGIDKDAQVLECAQRNLPSPHEWICGEVSGNMELPNGPFDAVIGGPPCQPYSRASRHRTFEADSRNGVTDFWM